MNIESTKINDDLLIFPYAFVRYASGHHAEFDRLRLYNWNTFYSDLKALEVELKNARQHLVDYLFHKVAVTENISEKQQLINLKRSIYNDRSLPELESLSGIISGFELQDFGHYTQLKKDKDLLANKWALYYENHIATHHLILQKLASDELFLKGIRLSSKDLFDQVLIYNNTSPKDLTQKHFRIEYSLLRYLTRTYFKTSPFSTFTHIGLSKVRESDNILALPSNYSVLSHVRLNNHLFDHLKNLLSAHSEINNYLSVIFNPTIKLEEDKVSFLINFHNLESFQTINAIPVIVRLLEIHDNAYKEITLVQIVEELSHEIEATPSQIKDYLINLIEMGLLEFDFQVSALSPDWDTQFIDYLKKRECSHILLQNTINLLETLKAESWAYESADLMERNAILEKMFTASQCISDKFLLSLGLGGIDKKAYKREYQQKFDTQSFRRHSYLLSTLQPENIIYEDSFTRETGKVESYAIKQIIVRINELGKFLFPFNSGRFQQRALVEFFLSNFDVGQEVDLLDFYREYCEAANEKLEGKDKTSENNHTTDDKRFRGTYHEQMMILKESLKQIVEPDREQICLTKLVFNEPQEDGLNAQIRLSRAMFAQLYADGENLLAVVNNVFLGMGRASGRFLHLFDQEITIQQRMFNEAVSGEHILMELSDGSFFNANLHPNLLSFELKIPNGQTSLPADKQIEAKDILVYFDKVSNKVCLRDKNTKKQIIPFDLCLQSITQRSKLYQLLSQFAIDPNINFSPIREAVQQILYGEDNSFEKRDIYFMPRIVYEQCIVLKRKSWTVRTQSIPQKSETKSEAEYFISINEWRIAHHIPSEVFLYIKLDSQAGEHRSDDYKPQYICFETPLIISLWSKLLKKAGEFIYMEEMLPGAQQLNGHTVNETLIQWYGG